MKDADVALLATWVEMGAPWGSATTEATKPTQQKFWAFVPPIQPTVPAVKNKSWVRSPIDSFVLAALEAKGLTPAKQADKRTLIRRASYDLIGLPPTPRKCNRFSQTTPRKHSPCRRSTPGIAEIRRTLGAHWLDVARYADSNGLDENLVYRNAFRYRDYVIAAFNKDKPYDQFLQEQLAGDLLPADDEKLRYERLTATGFLSPRGQDARRRRPGQDGDGHRRRTARHDSRAHSWALRVGCARCHDHKFDPISQADYYSLAGIFKSSKTMENFKVVAKWHEYVLAPKADRDRLLAHEAKVEEKRKEISKITGRSKTRS